MLVRDAADADTISQFSMLMREIYGVTVDSIKIHACATGENILLVVIDMITHFSFKRKIEHDFSLLCISISILYFQVFRLNFIYKF